MAHRPAEMKDVMTERERERELIELALRASEERFQTAFYSSPMAMAITTLAEG